MGSVFDLAFEIACAYLLIEMRRPLRSPNREDEASRNQQRWPHLRPVRDVVMAADFDSHEGEKMAKFCTAHGRLPGREDQQNSTPWPDPNGVARLLSRHSVNVAQPRLNKPWAADLEGIVRAVFESGLHSDSHRSAPRQLPQLFEKTHRDSRPSLFFDGDAYRGSRFVDKSRIHFASVNALRNNRPCFCGNTRY